MSEQFLSDSQKNVRAAVSARCLTHTAPKQSTIEAIDLKSVSETEVLVKTCFSGISRGTERLVYNGHVPSSEWQRMRCPHQIGDFSFPVTYGYSSVGIVKSVGSKVTKTRVGDHVFVLHPHQDNFIVDETWINVLPPTIRNIQLAVLSANMETALNANWDAKSDKAKSIAVIGGGVVGLLTAFIAKKRSRVTPVIVDIDPEKENIAKSLGLSFTVADTAKADESKRYECIFHTSASQQGLQLAIDIAGFEGRIIEMSWFGSKPVTLDLGGAFHSQRLQLISSQVGHVAPEMRETHTHADRMAAAFEYLDDPTLEALLTPSVHFSQLPSKINALLTSDKSLCPLVMYSDSQDTSD